MTGDNTTLSMIEGKVAKVLNDRELIINRGSEHGVELGMKFKIMDRIEDIIDPDTQNNLGAIEREKIRVKVDHVQSSLCIARTYETYHVPVDPIFRGLILSRLSGATKVKTLQTSGTTDDNGTYVKVGDRVIQLSEGEE